MEQNIHDILKQYWGYDTFRPKQEEIILSILDQHDTLALLPTGGGKSICFQVPAIAMEGLCLVVTPLIALMKDQVEKLTSLGIKAAAIYTGLKFSEIERILNNCLYGGCKFLYLSPERLKTDIFSHFASEAKVNLIAVDEAHCISEWGYDFRPSYLKIADARDFFPGIPVLALTATATTVVREDIIKKLKFSDFHVFQTSFERKNLIYAVVHDESKYNKLCDILKKVNGSGIVYVRTRKTSKEIADFLNNHHIPSDFYHGGLDNPERTKKQEKWMKGQTRIMVSTNAFGMGIDKPDVRIVIHFNPPDCMEAYYQEAGRAGRDLKKSYSVVLVNINDLDDLVKRGNENFPDIREIKTVYKAMGNYFQLPEGSGENIEFDFDIRDFCKKFNLDVVKSYNAIKILENHEIIRTTDEFFLPSRLFIQYSYKELYEFQLNNPSYEPLIKTLLRSYEGLYDIYIRIDETEIAKRIDIPVESVIKQLKSLTNQGVVDYVSKKNKPQVVFIANKIDEKHLPLDQKSILDRKKLYEHKIQEIIKFAFEYQGCRTQFILRYFGEESGKPCGHCDYCINKNKEELSNLEFNDISEKILALLKVNPTNINELTEVLKTFRKEKIVAVTRWMIDNNKIKIDKDNNVLFL